MNVEEGHILYMVSIEPESGWEDKFNEWYNTQHLPELLACPGFNAAWRFEAVEGSPRFLAFYDVDSMDVFTTPEYTALRARTPDQLQELAQEVFPHRKSTLNAKYEQFFQLSNS